jgi:hypothetical protein
LLLSHLVYITLFVFFLHMQNTLSTTLFQEAITKK